MAPIKFEEHIKEKLNEREIKPSVRTWSEISAGLEVSQKTKKKGVFWYGIAASFIGLIMISVVYFSSENGGVNSEVEIVDAPENSNKKEEEKQSSNIEGVNQEAYVVTEQKQIHSNTEINKSDALLLEKKSIEQKKEIEISVASVENKEENKIFKNTEEIINSKIGEVVAQVIALEENNRPVTGEEVDALLLKAQKEILRDKLFRKDASVDAMALLSEVEMELDESFRNQIFEALKTGYSQVKNAVADRNN
ncbi:MAG: hypothetical protein V3U92_10260 [Cellulophaga sp.]